LFYQFLRKSKYEDLASQLSKINNTKYYQFLSGGIPFNDMRIYKRKFKLNKNNVKNKDFQEILENEGFLKFTQSSIKRSEIKNFNLNKEDSGKWVNLIETIKNYGNSNWLSWLQFCYQRVKTHRDYEDSILFSYITANLEVLLQYSSNQFERIYWVLYKYVHNTILKKYILTRKLLQNQMILFTENGQLEHIFHHFGLNKIWNNITNPKISGKTTFFK
jgi:hypothetical protein